MIPLKDDNPTSTFPLFTIGIIVLNSLIFFYQQTLGEAATGFVFTYGAVPEAVSSFRMTDFPAPLTILTSMFLHGGWFHLIGNMLFLWIFGKNIEDQLGHLRFLIFYLICGVIASLAHIMVTPHSSIPMVGASGAIAGVLGAYLIRFPNARILTLIWFGFFIRVVRVPAIFFLGFWFILQLLYGLPSLALRDMGGIAFFAHIGGFIAGLLLFPFWERRLRRKGSYHRH
ncbi:MAG: rhomboid family intramembrane serine protease [Candidatus Zixiibacteriota bacterium]